MNGKLNTDLIFSTTGLVTQVEALKAYQDITVVANPSALRLMGCNALENGNSVEEMANVLKKFFNKHEIRGYGVSPQDWDKPPTERSACVVLMQGDVDEDSSVRRCRATIGVINNKYLVLSVDEQVKEGDRPAVG